jgi:hypothetical protein
VQLPVDGVDHLIDLDSLEFDDLSVYGGIWNMVVSTERGVRLLISSLQGCAHTVCCGESFLGRAGFRLRSLADI